jgi:hypothetical protein
MPTPRRTGFPVVAASTFEAPSVVERLLPARAKRLEARGQPRAGLQDLAGGGRGAGPERVPQADLQPIDPELVGDVVDERLVREPPPAARRTRGTRRLIGPFV